MKLPDEFICLWHDSAQQFKFTANEDGTYDKWTKDLLTGDFIWDNNVTKVTAFNYYSQRGALVAIIVQNQGAINE